MTDDERISLERTREFLDRVRTRVQDSYGQVEIETLVGRTLQTLSLATREVGFRLGELEANRYPGARWQVSPAQADLAGRFLLALVELRQQTWLNVARDLNTMLGEDSPNVDDALYKCLGDRASYEAWLEAMRRAMDAGRKAYREPRKQEPGAQTTGGRATGRRESTAAGDDDPSTRNRNYQLPINNDQLKTRDDAAQEAVPAVGDRPRPGESTQESTRETTKKPGPNLFDVASAKSEGPGVADTTQKPESEQLPQAGLPVPPQPEAQPEPVDELAEKHRVWLEAYETWTLNGDYRAPIPEFPADVLEDFRKYAADDPVFAQGVARGENALRARARQVHLAGMAGGYHKLPAGPGGACPTGG